MEQSTANKQFFNILNNKIKTLIEHRRNTPPSEHTAINEKLTKLYNLKWQYLEH